MADQLGYGVRKLWNTAQRACIEIGRDQVARLMKILDTEGERSEKLVKTTKTDPEMPLLDISAA